MMRTVSEANKARYLEFGIYLLLLLGLIARRPVFFWVPQFWAEDGAVFYKTSVTEGLALFESYAGYLHVTQRIFAYLCSFFPAAWAPSLYQGVAVLAILFTASQIMGRRLDLPLKPLMALCIVYIPHYGEVFLTLTNVQWFLALVLIVMAFEREAQNYKEQAWDGIRLLIIGMTGPFIILAWPLYLWKWFKTRRNPNYIFFALAALSASIQAYHLLLSNMKSLPLLINSQWVSVIGRRMSATLWLSPEHAPYFTDFMFVIFLLGVLFLITLALPRYRYREAILGFMAMAFILTLAAFHKYKGDPGGLIPFENGDRYFYIPRITLTWSLILLLSHYKAWIRSISLCLVGLTWVASMYWFQQLQMINYHWERYHQKVDLYEKVEIPINPKGFRFTVQKPVQTKQAVLHLKKIKHV